MPAILVGDITRQTPLILWILHPNGGRQATNNWLKSKFQRSKVEDMIGFIK